LGILLTILSALSLFLALIFSILVLKVWLYERLCDPIHRLRDTVLMSDEIEVFSKSLCDFAIATERNYKINNKRTKYLSYAIGFLLFGTISTLITVTILNFIIRRN